MQHGRACIYKRDRCKFNILLRDKLCDVISYNYLLMIYVLGKRLESVNIIKYVLGLVIRVKGLINLFNNKHMLLIYKFSRIKLTMNK